MSSPVYFTLMLARRRAGRARALPKRWGARSTRPRPTNSNEHCSHGLARARVQCAPGAQGSAMRSIRSSIRPWARRARHTRQAREAGEAGEVRQAKDAEEARKAREAGEARQAGGGGHRGVQMRSAKRPLPGRSGWGRRHRGRWPEPPLMPWGERERERERERGTELKRARERGRRGHQT